MIPQVGNLVSYRGAVWLVHNVTGSLLDLVRLTGVRVVIGFEDGRHYWRHADAHGERAAVILVSERVVAFWEQVDAMADLVETQLRQLDDYVLDNTKEEETP